MIKKKITCFGGDEKLDKGRKVEIYGGRAGYNYVSFTGENYKSISRFKGKKVITEIRLKKEYRKVTNIISRIPFVRSFSLIIELILEYWKRFLFTIVVLFLMDFIIKRSNSNPLHSIPINSLAMLFGFFVIAGLIIKITSIGKYHGAEHMVANAYVRDQNLTLEKVKMQPRTHKNCGTNLVVTIFVCFSILFLVFGDPFWVFLVAWAIGYELWRNEPKVIWNLILVIGKLAQYLLFTSKPKEKHLAVAIEAITKLEEIELANRVE